MKTPEQWSEELVVVREIPRPAGVPVTMHRPYRLNVAGQDVGDYAEESAAARRAEFYRAVVADVARLVVGAVRVEALAHGFAGCPVGDERVKECREAVRRAMEVYAGPTSEYGPTGAKLLDLLALIDWQRSVIATLSASPEGDDLKVLLDAARREGAAAALAGQRECDRYGMGDD